MELCIAKTKKGIPCNKKISKDSHLQRTCLTHEHVSFVTRPDITEPPPNPPPRNSKLDPYAIHTCLVVGCGQPNMLGKFVCDFHEYKQYLVKDGIQDERHHFTPYYQQLVLQQDLRLNDSEYQERVRQDKERLAQLEPFMNVVCLGQHINRQLNPYYIKQCCCLDEGFIRGPIYNQRCTNPNRFGYLTCEQHSHLEYVTQCKWQTETSLNTRKYQDLLYEEMVDPRLDDEEFHNKIAEHVEQHVEASYSRIRQYNPNTQAWIEFL